MRRVLACAGRISIHVLREEDDPKCIFREHVVHNFYPRPPRGGRLAWSRNSRCFWVFLSTSSARRTTNRRKNQSRRAYISIHVLREEDDRRDAAAPRVRPAFLSTSSARRTTLHVQQAVISDANFYPRPPRGGRPPMLRNHRSNLVFLSTSSARRTTNLVYREHGYYAFLSTSSARRTTRLSPSSAQRSIFLSTSSARRTTSLSKAFSTM